MNAEDRKAHSLQKQRAMAIIKRELLYDHAKTAIEIQRVVRAEMPSLEVQAATFGTWVSVARREAGYPMKGPGPKKKLALRDGEIVAVDDPLEVVVVAQGDGDDGSGFDEPVHQEDGRLMGDPRVFCDCEKRELVFDDGTCVQCGFLQRPWEDHEAHIKAREELNKTREPLVKADLSPDPMTVEPETANSRWDERKARARALEDAEFAAKMREANARGHGPAAPSDPWQNRTKGMRCETCVFYVPKERTLIGVIERDDRTEKVYGGSVSTGGELGRCRRHSPTMSGYPVVFPDDWCGDHRLDENKVGA